MISSRKALWGGIFLVLAAFPWWKVLLVDFLAPPGFEYLKKGEVRPVDRFVIDGMKFTRSRGGDVDITVSASRAYGGSLTGSRINLQDVSIVLSGQAEENVQVVSKKGSYYREKDRIILPEEFTVVSRGTRIKGKELYYNLKTGDYRVESGVVCNFNPV